MYILCLMYRPNVPLEAWPSESSITDFTLIHTPQPVAPDLAVGEYTIRANIVNSHCYLILVLVLVTSE